MAHIFIYYNVAYEVKSFCTIVIPFIIKKAPLNPSKHLTALHRIRYDKGTWNSKFSLHLKCKESKMKIYYSKYIGYGSLAFACALFIHLAFLSILGFEGFPKITFITLIQILLFLPCCKMKCNTKDMFIWYTRVAKNSIKENEHVH